MELFLVNMYDGWLRFFKIQRSQGGYSVLGRHFTKWSDLEDFAVSEGCFIYAKCGPSVYARVYKDYRPWPEGSVKSDKGK